MTLTNTLIDLKNNLIDFLSIKKSAVVAGKHILSYYLTTSEFRPQINLYKSKSLKKTYTHYCL